MSALFGGGATPATPAPPPPPPTPARMATIAPNTVAAQRAAAASVNTDNSNSKGADIPSTVGGKQLFGQ